MPQRSVATNYTFEQQRSEINLLAADFWSHKTAVDNAASTYLKHDGSNDFTGGTLAVPNAFTINSNGGQGTLTISGNLTVTGTTTTVNTTNLDVTDKNITIAKGNTSDATADGAGITIDSGTDITWNFVDAKDAWVSSIGVEATTFLKGPYGQFTGSGVPTTGMGVEVNAPDANTGQIISYDRGNTAYKDLRIKGSSVGVYTGTSNAIVGTFNSTGLTLESGKTLGVGVAPKSGEGSELAVKGSDGATNVALVPNADTEFSQVSFYNAAYDSQQGYIKYDNNDNSLSFRVNLQERFRIASNGNVAIGNNPTVHADTIFHVEKPSGETNVKFEGDTTSLGARLTLQNNNTDAGAYNAIGFNQADGKSTSNVIGYNTDQTNVYGELGFLTRNAAGQPPIERVRIDKDGRVGIGTQSPQDYLDLGNATGGRGIAWGGSNGTSHYNTIWSEYSSGSLVIGAGLRGSTSDTDFHAPWTGTVGYAAIELDSFSDDGIKFYTAADAAKTEGDVVTKEERVRITTNGYFGVGETPTTKVGVSLAAQVADGTDDGDDWGPGGIFQLDATGTAANNNEILFVGAHSGGNAQIASGFGFGRENTSNWGTYLSFKTHSTGTSNIDELIERARITSSGVLRIIPADTSSNYATTDGGIDICQSISSTGTSSSQSIGIQFSLTKSGETGAISEIGAIRTGSGESGLVFRTRDNSTGRNERLRIDSSGNLHLRSAATCRLVLGSSGGPVGDLTNNENWIRGSGTMLQLNTAGGDYGFEVSGSQKMKLDTSGNLELRSATQNRLTFGSAGSSGNDTNWVRGDGNNLMFNGISEQKWEIAGNEIMQMTSGALIPKKVVTNKVGSYAYYSRPILEITAGGTPTQCKITTGIPWSGDSSHAHSVRISGFRYANAEAVDLQICWHVYNNSFYNRTASSSGAWTPTITLAVENNYVVIHLTTPGYWPKFYVESLYHAFGSAGQGQGWSWADAAVNGDAGKPVETVNYKNKFGNGVNIDGTGLNVNAPIIMGNDYGISFINADDTATGETVYGSVLDDYEYGYFVPTIGTHSNINSTAGIDSSHTGTGWYTKIGKQVTVTVDFNALHTNARDHVLRYITGLPYESSDINKATATIGYQRGLRFVYSSDVFGGQSGRYHHLYGYIGGNTTQLSLGGSMSYSPYSGWPATHDSGSSQYLRITITYQSKY